LEQERLDCRRLAFFNETDSAYACSRRKIASGGRAFTDRESFAVPFNHGCTWLSAGDYNPLLKLAMEEGCRVEARFFPTANTKTFLEDR